MQSVHTEIHASIPLIHGQKVGIAHNVHVAGTAVTIAATITIAIIKITTILSLTAPGV